MSMLLHWSRSLNAVTSILPFPTSALPLILRHSYPLFSLNDRLSQIPDITGPFILRLRPAMLMSVTFMSNQLMPPSNLDLSLVKFSMMKVMS